nr:sarcosine oxidase subunit gamma family protein [Amylibacter sp.]
MGKFTLTALPVLGGFDQDYNGTRLRELVDLAAVAVSVPMGGADALGQAMKTAFGGDIPAVGQSYLSKDGSRIVGFAPDQMMVLFDHAPHSGVAAIEQKLGTEHGAVGYYVEQTNNWVTLELDGPLARAALERLCALNLHPDSFVMDRAERTTMEHMGALVIRTGEDCFVLMGPSSMAASFLHAITVSLEYVI